MRHSCLHTKNQSQCWCWSSFSTINHSADVISEWTSKLVDSRRQPSFSRKISDRRALLLSVVAMNVSDFNDATAADSIAVEYRSLLAVSFYWLHERSVWSAHLFVQHISNCLRSWSVWYRSDISQLVVLLALAYKAMQRFRSFIHIPNRAQHGWLWSTITEYRNMSH